MAAPVCLRSDVFLTSLTVGDNSKNRSETTQTAPNALSGLGRTVVVVHNFDFSVFDDHELCELVAGAVSEQHQRALACGDLPALIAEGFEVGFTGRGEAREPYLVEGVLVCPGSLIEKSALSHDCVFVHVGEDWVWDSGLLLLDDVRKIPERSRIHQRSVSLVAAVEGLEFDWVVSAMRNSVHTMKKSVSYTIAGGQLKVVSARTASKRGVGH